MRPCPEPGCPSLVTIGYCPTHRRERDKQRRTTMRGGHLQNNKRWRIVRMRVLRRNPRCVVCGGPATIADHIVAVEDGGALYDETNLQSMCASCHSRKTNREVRARYPGGLR